MYSRFERVTKPIDNPDHMSLLMITRNNPDRVDATLRSFENTIEDFSKIDLWVYVDHDDKNTIEYIDSLNESDFSFVIHWQIEARPLSMGQMLNHLRKVCTTNPGLYMITDDDMIMQTKNWDAKVRQTMKTYPDGIFVGYIPNRSIVRSDCLMYAVLTASWINIVGKIHTDNTPYWTNDTLIDLLAKSVKRKIEIEGVYFNQTSTGDDKNSRMKNLPFWSRYAYSHCIKEAQLIDAEALLKEIYGEGTKQFTEEFEYARTLMEDFVEETKKMPIEKLQNMEKRYSSFPENPNCHLRLVYLALESRALFDLFDKIDLAMQFGDYTRALELLDIVSLAEQKYQDVGYLRDICLKNIDNSDSTHCHDNSLDVAKKLFDHAVALLNGGNPQESLKYLGKVEELSPKYPTLYFAKACAYAHAGEFFEAKKSCEKEIVLDPENQMTRQFYQKINQAIVQAGHSVESPDSQRRALDISGIA